MERNVEDVMIKEWVASTNHEWQWNFAQHERGSWGDLRIEEEKGGLPSGPHWTRSRPQHSSTIRLPTIPAINLRMGQNSTDLSMRLALNPYWNASLE